MELTYDSIMEFFQEYFPAYNAYAQDPDTTQEMHKYYTPDLEFIPYVDGLEHMTSRDEFLRIMSSHPSSFETIVPQDIIIDEKHAVVCVLAKTEVTDWSTGDVLVKKFYLPRYYLILDENMTIKIKSMEFFWEVLPPGTPDVHEVFRRDQK
jgi:hypothetical protein